MRVLYLVPDLFGAPGGIARSARLVIRALSESDVVTCIDVLALHDVADAPMEHSRVGSDRASYRGFASNRQAFATAAIAALLRGRYDVAITAHVNFAPLLVANAGRASRAKRVVFVHGIDAWRRLPLVRRLALLRADQIIAVSHFSAQRAAQANDIPAERVSVLHHCLDPALDPGESTPARAPGHTILTVARLSRADAYKGHATVIRALPRILEQVPDAQYVVVGEGELRLDLERLAAQLDLRQHVSFLGRVSDPELKECYARSSVFAMPSTDEGFGLVFLEAMAHRRPVICGNRDAGPEVIGRDELAGRLVDPGDPDGVVEAIVPILRDADLQARLGAGGRARVDALFSYPKFKGALVERLDR